MDIINKLFKKEKDTRVRYVFMELKTKQGRFSQFKNEGSFIDNIDLSCGYQKLNGGDDYQVMFKTEDIEVVSEFLNYNLYKNTLMALKRKPELEQ